MVTFMLFCLFTRAKVGLLGLKRLNAKAKATRAVQLFRVKEGSRFEALTQGEMEWTTHWILRRVGAQSRLWWALIDQGFSDLIPLITLQPTVKPSANSS